MLIEAIEIETDREALALLELLSELRALKEWRKISYIVINKNSRVQVTIEVYGRGKTTERFVMNRGAKEIISIFAAAECLWDMLV